MDNENLDTSFDIEDTQEIQDSVVDKTQEQQDILYSGSGIYEVLSDFQVDLEYGSEPYEDIQRIMNHIDQERDYTPTEVDSLLTEINLPEENISQIEDAIIQNNDTNIQRKENFTSDTDEDIYQLNTLIETLEEQREKFYTIAGFESVNAIISKIKKTIARLESLKNSYDGSFAIWDNNIDKVNNAYNKKQKILLLPDEEGNQ